MDKSVLYNYSTTIPPLYSINIFSILKLDFEDGRQVLQ